MKEQEKQETEAKTTGKRKRLWRRIATGSLLTAAILAIVLLFAPRIASSGAVRRYILSRVNEQVDGEISVTNWTLTWRNGLQFDEIAFGTGDGTVRFSGVRLSISEGLLAFAGPTNDLGRIRLVAPELALSPPPDRPVAQAATVRAERAPDETPAAPAAPAPGGRVTRNRAAESRSAKGRQRDIVADISLSQGKITLAGREGPDLVLQDITASARISSLGKPIPFAVEAVQSNGTGRISLEGRLQLQGDDGSGTAQGKAKLSVVAFDMTALSAMNAYVEGMPQLRGLLNSEWDLRLDGAREMALVARTEVTGFQATGGALGVDSPACDRMTLDCEIGMTNSLLTVRKAKFDSPFGRVSVEGTIRPAEEGGAPRGELTAEATMELAQVAAQMPRTLKLRPGLTVKEGRASMRSRLRLDAGKTEFSANLITTPIRALQEQKAVGIDSPMQLRAEGRLDARGIDLKTLKLDTPFAKLSGRGSVTNLAIDLTADLAAAQREAAKFVELGKKRLAGELRSVIRMHRASEQSSALSAVVTINNLRVDGATPEPLTQARARGVLNAHLVTDEAGRVENLSRIRLRCEAAPFAADATVERFEWPNATRPLSLHDGMCSVTGDVARIMAKAVDVGLVAADPKRKAGGKFAVVGRFAVASNVVSIAEASAAVTSLIFDNGTAGIHEPEIRIAAGGTIAPDTWNLESVKVSSRPYTLSATGRVTDVSSSCLLDLAGTARADLERVGEIVCAFTGMEIEMAGSEEGVIRYRGPLRADSGQGILQKADAETALYVERLVWKGAKVEKCRPTVKLSDGQLVAEVKSAFNEGELNLVPLVDFTQTPPLLQVPENTPIVSDAKLDEALTGDLLAHVHPVLKGSAVIDGMVSVDMAHLRLPLSSNVQSTADFEGSLVFTNVTLKPDALLGDVLDACQATSAEAVIPYQRVRFVCRDGKLKCDPLRIETSRATLIMSGSIGLDGTLAYRAELPITDGMLSSRYHKYVKDVTIAVPIGGTIDDPHVDRDALRKDLTKLTAKVAENYLKEEGTKRLEEKATKLLEEKGAEYLKKLFE